MLLDMPKDVRVDMLVCVVLNVLATVAYIASIFSPRVWFQLATVHPVAWCILHHLLNWPIVSFTYGLFVLLSAMLTVRWCFQDEVLNGFALSILTICTGIMIAILSTIQHNLGIFLWCVYFIIIQFASVWSYFMEEEPPVEEEEEEVGELEKGLLV